MSDLEIRTQQLQQIPSSRCASCSAGTLMIQAWVR